MPVLSIEPCRAQPDKQRLIAAMRGKPSGRVPNFEVLIEDRHVERLLGWPAGNTLGVGGDPAKASDAAGLDPRSAAMTDRTARSSPPHLGREGRE
jgi:hypothetical protein